MRKKKSFKHSRSGGEGIKPQIGKYVSAITQGGGGQKSGTKIEMMMKEPYCTHIFFRPLLFKSSENPGKFNTVLLLPTHTL